MTNNTETPVVCAIIESENRVLAAQRGKSQSNAGLWEFPGGKVYSGETPVEALIREIREELAVEIEVMKPLEPASFRYPWILIKLIPFVCSIREGRPSALEHEKVDFFTREECGKILWAPADLPILEQYWAEKDKIRARPGEN